MPNAAVSPAAAGANALGGALLASVHAPPTEQQAAASTSALGTFVSPICIASALALLANGAVPGSAAAEQLCRALLPPAPAAADAATGSAAGGGDSDSAGCGGGCRGGTSDPAAVSAAYASLAAELRGAAAAGGAQGAAPLTLDMAASIWAKPPLSFKPAYQLAAARDFGACAQPLTGAQAVNDWVSEQTRGKITDLVDEGGVARSVAVLVSALYFKGLWATPFQARLTARAPFALGGGGEAQVAMMHAKFERGQAACAQAADRSFEALRLPYKGDQFAAVALLPAPGGGPGAAAAAATAAAGGALAALRWGRPEVLVWLPRFKLECGARLKGPLRRAGVAAPFVPSGAFSEMLEGESQLLVDDVIHKVFIEVNEEGTEAAAATAVMMMRAALVAPPMELRFDRPFAFGVQHTGSGALLFVGVVERPGAWEEGE